MPTTRKDPKWWNKEDESAWSRVKEAFRRDWKQTKHDFGGNEPDLNQDVSDTAKQAVGSEPIPPGNQPNFEDYEPALRFGYGARRHYGSKYSEWDDRLEAELRQDFGAQDWDRYRPAVREGWEREANTAVPKR